MPTVNKYDQLIKTLQQFHSIKWINQYFDLLKKLLQDIDVEGDDPRLAMSITNKKLPVNLGQRYILKPLPNQKIGIIVPLWFEEESVNGKVNFWFRSNGQTDAKWIIIDFPIDKQLPRALYNACIEACADILHRCKRSGYRKHHVELLYDFTVEQAVRNEIMGELNI